MRLRTVPCKRRGGDGCDVCSTSHETVNGKKRCDGDAGTRDAGVAIERRMEREGE